MSQEVEKILSSLNLPTTELERAPGFANEVWMTQDHVIRINDGRFKDAFKHEAEVLRHLKGVLPVPTVVAVEGGESGGEVVVLERLPGTNLQDAWPDLPSRTRTSIVHQLGELMQTMHSIPLADWMANPAFDTAIATGNARNAYQAPPSEIDMLLASAAGARPDLEYLLTRIREFVQLRLHLFANDDFHLVHADLHFRNVIVSGDKITGIIDFEGTRPAPIDVELDILIRWLTERIATDPDAYTDVIPDLRSAYPTLFETPDLVNRLEVYEILWQLVQLHHWHPGAKWMNDPGGNLENVLRGSFRIAVGRILENQEPGLKS